MRRYKIARIVGRKIRVIRRRGKLTQEEIVDKVGIHVSTLGRIERGETNPPLQTINKIARALHVKPKELF